MALAEVETPMPWEAANNSFDQSADMPDVMEFITSPQYLYKANLYPRQATLLKIIFLQPELFTPFDLEVIDSWTGDGNFVLPPKEKWVSAEPIHYEGMHGLPPDVYERIAILKDQGRLWFDEILNVTGRRGSKGYLGGLCGAYVTWHYHRKGDPQSHYGVDPSKKLGAYVFAGKRDQAKSNQWRDLVDVILNAPCYEKFIEEATAELLSVNAPTDADKVRRLRQRGIKSNLDMATFHVVPKESTLMAGRGPALYLIYFDEMAHVVATGANRSAEEVYDAATPALDQFKPDAFKYCGSSPWQMMGKFYELCQQALEIEQGPDSEWHPVYPEKLLIQLTSWDPYEDWERSRLLPMVPEEYAEALADGAVEGRLKSDYYFRDSDTGDFVKRFVRIKRPIQTYDDEMRKLERANPETFAVERRSHWAAAMDAYLNPQYVAEMFEPFAIPGVDEPEPLRVLTQRSSGPLNITFVAHGDPSQSGKNFGWVIGHKEGPDDKGLFHVVFDKIHYWSPQQWEDGRQDYFAIAEEMMADIKAFNPSEVTFDQKDSFMMIQKLQKETYALNLPKRVNIYERTATGQLNWAMAECYKTSLGMGLLHAPYHELFELENRFLQLKLTEGTRWGRVDHPTMGPVQTKDIWDAAVNVTWGLIGDQMAAFIKKALGDLEMRFSGEGGQPDPAGTAQGNRDTEVQEAFNQLGRARGVREGAPRGGYTPRSGAAARRRT